MGYKLTLNMLGYAKEIDNNVIIGYNLKGENDAKYFVYDSSKMTMFGKYNKEIFVSKGNQKISNDISAGQYDPLLASCGSKVISADTRGVTLELIDVKTKSIIKDRFYTKFTLGTQVEGGATCDPVDLYADIFILTFDWDLNPIKKYHVGTSSLYGFKYFMSQDCKKIYCLSTEGEEQTLFEGTIN